MREVLTLLLVIPLLGAAGDTIKTIAGSGKPGYSGDGRPGPEGQVNNPYGITIGPDGALYICEVDSHIIRRLDLKRGLLSTVAGNLRKGYAGDGGPAIEASLNEPYEVRFDETGNMYVVERMNHVVRRVDLKTKIIQTVAGTGVAGYSGDGGPASHAQLKQPHSIAFDNDGNLLICDIGNQRLRRVNKKTGVIQTIAGNGKGDGLVNGPRAVDVDPEGIIYLALREGNAVLRLDPDGSIHRIAGTGEKGYSGDGGPATQAKLSGPKGIVWSPEGALFVADTENHAIRRIDLKSGAITTVAGTGEAGFGPDGDPLKCKLSRPHGVYVDRHGNVYIGDSESHRVRRITGSRRR